MFFVFFKVLDAIVGNRVPAELEGLDMLEMGAMGYPDCVLTPGLQGHGPATSASTPPRAHLR